MYYQITIQPNKYNASDRDLILNFKKALMRYYKKLLTARYNKHKDRQYKMEVDLSHGRREYTSTHPHLHIIADIPTNEVQFFIDFLKSYLKITYKHINVHYSELETDLDKLKMKLYIFKQSVRHYTEKDFQNGNYIV